MTAPTPPTEEQLAEYMALAERATSLEGWKVVSEDFATETAFINVQHEPSGAFDFDDAAFVKASATIGPWAVAEVARLRAALTTIGHSLVCAPTDYAEHNARELLKAGNIARTALGDTQ